MTPVERLSTLPFMPHRLLLADDSVTIQKVIEVTFADEDIQVVAVSDGDLAIARLEAEAFDVVLADTGMPGRDGYALATFLKGRPDLSTIPVILLTGAFEQVDDTRVAASGAAAVLAKPFEPQMVIAKVRELLGGVRPRTGESPIVPKPEPAAATHALPAAPARSTSADEYFERLDRAFATLNPTLEPREPGYRNESEHPDAPTFSRLTRSGDHAAPDKGLADTFATLLAVEQGELPASALLPAEAGDDELVDRIARRVVEQLGDRAVRDLAADIVSRTAERLVREEIDRIKAGL